MLGMMLTARYMVVIIAKTSIELAILENDSSNTHELENNIYRPAENNNVLNTGKFSISRLRKNGAKTAAINKIMLPQISIQKGSPDRYHHPNRPNIVVIIIWLAFPKATALRIFFRCCFSK
ncbi:hypothetical protein SAMN05192588_2783 [Nonlabens sp. Hel1_33_55]|nr:hypothetical protein SAMN05192588_2783 [Nonlabens sp. Hel1_33_55]